MSQYKELANQIDKKELEGFYKDHLPGETCRKFHIPSLYLLKQVLNYLDIPVHTIAENTRIQFDCMSDDERRARGNRIGKSHLGHTTPQSVRDKISKAQAGIPRPSSKNSPTKWEKGHTPWNKGKKGVQHWSDGQAERRWSTMLRNGTAGNVKTLIERRVEEDLINRYGEDHVHYQYRDPRYPFNCDFYVDTEDLFIEVNNWWHHGPHPYDPDSEEDRELLADLKEKAATCPNSKQYQEAIRIWTQVDPKKIKTAEDNHLNYLTIYKY